MTAGGVRSRSIAIATNNGDIGGGEVMLLNIAESLAAMDFDVTVVGPTSPSALVDTARDRGFRTVALEAGSRLEYVLALRRWDRRHRAGLLWCNGLLPSVATVARKSRVVHLHQRPTAKLRSLAWLARWRALTTVVPSANMASVTPGARVLHNWVKPVVPVLRPTALPNPDRPVRVGFLGRPSTDKGVEVLCAAIRLLDEETGGDFRLVLGGESRFVDSRSSLIVEKALESLGAMVERTGWTTPADFFGRVDLLVCPSIWPESFGLVVAEALSAKIPVVVSDSGALPEVVGTDYPWIARTGDAKELAGMITLALVADRSALQRSYERWDRMFSPSAGSQNLKCLLSDIGYKASPKES